MNKSLKSSLSVFFSRLLDLIAPPACPGCNELFEIGSHRDALCPVCRAKWESEKYAECKRCKRELPDCRCHPTYNKNRVCDTYRSALFYRDGVGKNAVLALKYGAEDKLYELAAREIELLIFRTLDLKNDDLVIVYPKRSKKSVKKYGYDHTERIAALVSRHYGIPIADVILHRGAREQKTLSYGMRGQNAVMSFDIREGAEALLKGKRVVLIDDVVTTGATTVAIAALCKAKGALTVHCFTLARTE